MWRYSLGRETPLWHLGLEPDRTFFVAGYVLVYRP